MRMRFFVVVTPNGCQQAPTRFTSLSRTLTSAQQVACHEIAAGVPAGGEILSVF